MAVTITTPTGTRIKVEADFALIGRDRSCQIVLPDDAGLQPIHAKIKKVANRWLVEAEGDWKIQVGKGLPGRMSWLQLRRRDPPDRNLGRRSSLTNR